MPSMKTLANNIIVTRKMCSTLRTGINLGSVQINHGFLFFDLGLNGGGHEGVTFVVWLCLVVAVRRWCCCTLMRKKASSIVAMKDTTRWGFSRIMDTSRGCKEKWFKAMVHEWWASERILDLKAQSIDIAYLPWLFLLLLALGESCLDIFYVLSIKLDEWERSLQQTMEKNKSLWSMSSRDDGWCKKWIIRRGQLSIFYIARAGETRTNKMKELQLLLYVKAIGVFFEEFCESHHGTGRGGCQRKLQQLLLERYQY